MLRNILLIVAGLIHVSNAYRVICVYTNWAQYRPDGGKFMPEDVDPTLCTHLIYVYAKLKGNKLVPAEWNDEGTVWREGMYDRVNQLKQLNPELKTLLGVGGWMMGSKDFSKLAAGRMARKLFAKTTTKFLRDRNFDGLAIDWQHPTKRGGKPKDKENYSLLLKEVREAFDEDSKKTGQPGLLLATGVSASREIIDDAYEINNLTRYVDFINVMAYDLHGDWDNYTGHPSQLYAREEEFGPSTEVNVDGAMRYWMSKVPDRSKLILGVSAYGRTFTLRKARHNDYNVPTTGPGTAGEFTQQPGMLAYYERCSQFADATRVWDESSQVAYWYSGDQWAALEDTESIKSKVFWMRLNDVGGIMFSPLDMDDFSGMFCTGEVYPLLHAIHQAMHSPIPNNLRPVRRKIRPPPSTSTTTTTTTPATLQSVDVTPNILQWPDLTADTLHFTSTETARARRPTWPKISQGMIPKPQNPIVSAQRSKEEKSSFKTDLILVHKQDSSSTRDKQLGRIIGFRDSLQQPNIQNNLHSERQPIANKIVPPTAKPVSSIQASLKQAAKTNTFQGPSDVQATSTEISSENSSVNDQMVKQASFIPNASKLLSEITNMLQVETSGRTTENVINDIASLGFSTQQTTVDTTQKIKTTTLPSPFDVNGRNLDSTTQLTALGAVQEEVHSQQQVSSNIFAQDENAIQKQPRKEILSQTTSQGISFVFLPRTKQETSQKPFGNVSDATKVDVTSVGSMSTSQVQKEDSAPTSSVSSISTTLGNAKDKIIIPLLPSTTELASLDDVLSTATSVTLDLTKLKDAIREKSTQPTPLRETTIVSLLRPIRKKNMTPVEPINDIELQELLRKAPDLPTHSLLEGIMKVLGTNNFPEPVIATTSKPSKSFLTLRPTSRAPTRAPLIEPVNLIPRLDMPRQTHSRPFIEPLRSTRNRFSPSLKQQSPFHWSNKNNDRGQHEEQVQRSVQTSEGRRIDSKHLAPLPFPVPSQADTLPDKRFLDWKDLGFSV